MPQNDVAGESRASSSLPRVLLNQDFPNEAYKTKIQVALIGSDPHDRT